MDGKWKMSAEQILNATNAFVDELVEEFNTKNIKCEKSLRSLVKEYSKKFDKMNRILIENKNEITLKEKSFIELLPIAVPIIKKYI